MNREQVESLGRYVEWLERKYSNRDVPGLRDMVYRHHKTFPTGDHAAWVVMEKSNGDYALYWCFMFVHYPQAGWQHLVVGDSHLLSMSMGDIMKLYVEEHNWNNKHGIKDDPTFIPEETLA